MKILDAKTRFAFYLSQLNINKGVRYDKKKCALANSLRAHKDICDVVIGAAISTITFTSGKVVRYKTTPILRDALNYWDKTGEWGLPPGWYYLEPLPKKTEPNKPKGKRVKFYTTGRKCSVAPNPRHMAFLRKQRAA